jgi:hypothetical protein
MGKKTNPTFDPAFKGDAFAAVALARHRWMQAELTREVAALVAELARHPSNQGVVCTLLMPSSPGSDAVDRVKGGRHV